MTLGLHLLVKAMALLLSPVFAFVGVLALAKLALGVVSILRRAPLDLSSDEGDGPDWAWPRDRLKIVARALGFVVIAALSFGLAYEVARYAFMTR